MKTFRSIAAPRSTGRGMARLARRAGFTLVELIAVFVIIGLLAAAVVPNVMSAIRSGEEAACQQNLGKVRDGFLQYRQKYQKWPNQSGVGFFASLVTDKVWKPTIANTKRLNCPGVDLESLDPGVDEIPVEDWYATENADSINGAWSSYAGRDIRRARLRGAQGSGKTAMMADDNDPEGNHYTTTNVLWDDMTVRALELVEQQKAGLISEDETFIPVGPDSPIEGLRSLSIDK